MAILPIDQLKTKFETGDRPTGSDYADLIDTTSFNAISLGASGNNESTVTGIENPTVFDTINTTIWRSIKYSIQLSDSNGGTYESTEISIVFDGSNINMSEFGTVANQSGSIATISATLNNGIISMVVTPITRPMTIRFSRTGLKV